MKRAYAPGQGPIAATMRAEADLREASPPFVVVCVCTRGRRAMLQRCLGSLLAQEIDASQFLFGVFVIENGPPEEAEAVFHALAAQSPHARFFREPEAGIPFARNTALREALAADADYIAFIDDDEIAPRNWIAALMHGLKAADADVAQGQVRKAPPGSALDAQIHEPAALADSWREAENAATCNTLFKAWLTRAPVGLRFDEAMRFTGGSDMDFFMRAHGAGARIVRLEGAHVLEEIAAGRDGLKYQCMRSFASGNNFNLRISKNRGGAVAVVLILMRALDRLLSGVAKLVAGALTWPFSPKGGAMKISQGLANLSFAAGCISPALRLRAQPYQRPQGT